MNYLSLFEEHRGWLFDDKRTFFKKTQRYYTVGREFWPGIYFILLNMQTR